MCSSFSCNTALYYSFSCSHWSRHIWPGGIASSLGIGLFCGTVPISGETAAGAWPLVVLSDVQVPEILLLQKFCFYFMPLLVCLLCGILGTGEKICFCVCFE